MNPSPNLSPSPSLGPSLYRPDIDGLRAVAVLAVVLHHLSASFMPGGYVGVDVFFVISGYLITSIISREMATGSFSFARFYERRARRIFPALFAVLAVTLVAGYFLLLPSDYIATLRGALGTLFFVSNMVFWRDMQEGYFAATDLGLNPLLHTWSLAVEEQFYLFYPLLLLPCLRYFRRHSVLLLAICAAVSLAAAAWLLPNKSVAVFFLSPFRAWELLAGALLALNAVPALTSRLQREALASAGLLAILAASFVYVGNTPFPGLAALAPVLGAAAIIHAGGRGTSLVGRLLQWRPLVYIGLMSYSLYLWHWPLIVLTRYAMGMAPITAYIPALLLAALVLGSLSYHFIEQPFRQGKRVSRQFIYASSAVFVSALAGVAVYGLVRGGNEERFTPAVVQFDKARTPNIPFMHCDGKPVGDACLLGQPDAKPTLLLWGDSHMLAWAPVLDQILVKRNISATFAINSGCPPLFNVARTYQPLCQPQNLAIKNYLLTNPNIKVVVMAGFWSLYFGKDGRLETSAGSPSTNGQDHASNALTATLSWLRDNGRQVVLIGPVPVYKTSVPLALALQQNKDQTSSHSNAAEQRQKNTDFFTVVGTTAAQGGGSLIFLDPILWLCPDECMVIKGGVLLYRDWHHLSVAGAIAFEAQLSKALAAR